MTSGNTYFTGFFARQKELLKRRLWPFALTLLGYFLFFVVGMSLTMSSSGIYYDYESAERFSAMRNDAINVLGTNGGICFITICVAAVLALQGFGWMHNRRTVDFYESQPVSRRTRFADICVSSFWMFIVSYVVMMLIGILIASSYHIVDNSVITAAMTGAVKAFSLFASIYFIGVLAAALTGNALISILAMGVLLGYEPIIRSVLSYYVSKYLPHIYGYSYEPVFLPIEYYFVDDTVFGVVVMLAMALLAGAAAYFCCHIRKNEAAGKAVIFRPVRTVVKIAIALLGGLVAEIFFNAVGNRALFLVFTCLFVVIIGCIMQIIYEYDFKALFHHPWELAVSVLATVMILLGFRADWLGINTWVPEPSSVKEASIRFNGNKYDEMMDENGDHLYENDYIEKYMHLTDIEAVTDIVKTALGQPSMMDDAGYYTGEYVVDYVQWNPWDYQEEQIVSFVVRYSMNDGRNIARTYSLPVAAYQEQMNRLMGSKEYKSGSFQVYHDEYISQNSSKWLVSYSNGITVAEARPLSSELYQMLREAYLADMGKYDFSLDFNESPVGSIRLEKAEKTRDDILLYYPVYSCFENTIKVLEGENIYVEKAELDSITNKVIEGMEFGEEDYTWYLLDSYFIDQQAVVGRFHDVREDIERAVAEYMKAKEDR